MLKKLFLSVAIAIVSIGLVSTAHAQIVVENASGTWESPIVFSELPYIPPRIITEYSTTIYEKDLVVPPDFEPPPRIIVEYATMIYQQNLPAVPICEGDFGGDGDVDGSDLAVFAADFGRTNCSGDCEGDFDEDGDVDGSDLAVFAADFGMTDCPFFPLIP